MAKSSEDLKVKVVKEYQDGFLGIRLLAKKYGIISKSEVGRWIQLYEKFGDEGLKRNKHSQSYPVQFKLDVLSFIKRTGSSEMETALHFGMKNPNIIASWKKSFREGDAEALERSKGRVIHDRHI